MTESVDHNARRCDYELRLVGQRCESKRHTWPHLLLYLYLLPAPSLNSGHLNCRDMDTAPRTPQSPDLDVRSSGTPPSHGRVRSTREDREEGQERAKRINQHRCQRARHSHVLQRGRVTLSHTAAGTARRGHHSP